MQLPQKAPARKPSYSLCEALLAEPADFPANPSDEDLHRGRCVLITGAGGSIGSALARQIASFQPSQLLLLDAAEHGLFELDLQLSRISPDLQRVPVVGSAGDQALVGDLLQQYAPVLVYHAAAHKHVPLMEQNPFAAIGNNSLGTWRLAETFARYRHGRLLMVSTDKAANPVSIMGASKRLAEIALQAYSMPAAPMSSIRLGNVLGTQGSVLATFHAQLAAGGPLTVTHPDMQRFFLRSDQAVALILEAMRSTDGGEIVAPVPGSAIRVLDLADYLIVQHRAKHGSHIDIAITGRRPGEKLCETFVGDMESSGDFVSGSLRRIDTPFVAAATDVPIHALRRAVEARDLEAMLQAVRSLVPDYAASSLLTQPLESEVKTAHA